MEHNKPKSYNLPATIFFLLVEKRVCNEGLFLEALPVFSKGCKALGGEKEILTWSRVTQRPSSGFYSKSQLA